MGRIVSGAAVLTLRNRVLYETMLPMKYLKPSIASVSIQHAIDRMTLHPLTTFPNAILCRSRQMCFLLMSLACSTDTNRAPGRALVSCLSATFQASLGVSSDVCIGARATGRCEDFKFSASF